MPNILPVPTARVSDALVTRRLLSELQFNERDLLRIQTQVSTGRRYAVASENPPSAQRAIGLQRLLEQKQQIQQNIETGQSYLGATDSNLINVGQLLAEVRGLAVSMANVTASDIERQAAQEQVNRTLEQLVQLGNRQFRGRYLFSGSQTTVEPYTFRGGLVQYNGNDRLLYSLSDLDALFQTNLSGDQVFGGTSPEVLGAADLTPRLTAETRLADLRGGQGVSPGSIAISDGATTSTIDVEDAENIGDLIRSIETNPPEGRFLAVDMTATGLILRVDTEGGGNLTVREVGGGLTAAELGILKTEGTGTEPIVGDDLNPRLTLTTRLDDILGVRAEAALPSAGADNDLIVRVRNRGPEWNDIAIRLVDDSLLQAAPGLTAGNETVRYTETAAAALASLALTGSSDDLVLTAVAPGPEMDGVSITLDADSDLGDTADAVWDPAAKTMTIGIDDSNETRLGTLVAAIEASGLFTVTPDDSAGEGYDPLAVVNSADAGIVVARTAGGADPQTLLIHVDAGHTTANDIISAIAEDGDVGELFEAQRDSRDTSGPNGAGQGVVSLSAQALTSGGSGVEFDKSSGLQIVSGGETHMISFEQAETIEGLLNIVNGADVGVIAEINKDRTGINLRSRWSGADFSVGENGGKTATDLGIRSLARDTPLGRLDYDRGIEAVEGVDFAIRRSDGSQLEIDVSSAATVGDVLDLINNHPDNLGPSYRIVAQLTDVGNGIRLSYDDPAPGDLLKLTEVNGSHAARSLGLIDDDASEVTASAIVGADPNPLETKSVFNTLIRLSDALHQNDPGQLERAVKLLDQDSVRISFSQAESGARQQALEVLKQRLEDEEVELRRSVSLELDVDLVESISDLTARQTAYEASLMSMGHIFQLSLLDFI